MQTLLEIKDLHIEVKQDGKNLSLCNNINFSVNPGETVGILGESGSGKSITSLSILRLLPPGVNITKGEVLFKSQNKGVIDLAKAPGKLLQATRGKEISMIFQEPMSSLNPVFTCGDQLLETILTHNNILKSDEAKNLSLELFKKVKLPDPERIFKSFPHQLSGGQKQRVMIAMAISCNPSLLIADEPTTALDVTVQKSVLELLRELQDELGMGIMFITHDISVLSEVAKKVLVFYRGEIVEQGSIENIFFHAQHPYTKGLISCRSSIYVKGERLKTLEDPYSNTPNTKNPEPTLPEVKPKLDEPLLSIRDLNLSFSKPVGLFTKGKKKQILHQINFDVFKGETLGLVGESGSGKTTIGRTIMHLIEAESGDIRLQGKQLTDLSGKELKKFRKDVQIIFQDPYSSLNPKMTVGDIIAETLQVHGLFKNSKERKKRVLELLHQVNLKVEYIDRYPHQFSGGQRQRIGIARALAVEPKLLILDESVSALDVSIQAQVLNLLNDLKDVYNLTYIFISHDLNTVRYMADRIVVLKNGYIMEQGDSEEIFTNPKTSYTSDLISAIPGKP